MKKDPLYKSFWICLSGDFQCNSVQRGILKYIVLQLFWLRFSESGCRYQRQNGSICFILFGLILALELVNTAVEATVDLFTEERKPLAKKAKDAAAGAVLIVAIFAAVIGILIFIPKLLDVAGL